ncbi:MAG: hypothetical protein GY782_11820, partial [Gammaproteobacteria bacterium]|nr:hypothetical protein [Gammaproteobacteria bacterium]
INSAIETLVSERKSKDIRFIEFEMPMSSSRLDRPTEDLSDKDTHNISMVYIDHCGEIQVEVMKN